MAHAMASSPPPASCSALEALPIDVFLFVLEHLDLSSIFRLTQTSKTMNKILDSPSISIIILRVICKEMPLPDPFSINPNKTFFDRGNPTVSSIRRRLAKCKLFHDAWANPSDESILTDICGELEIPEKIYMIRILPYGRYLVVVDYKEQAQFFEISTGKRVGIKSFAWIDRPGPEVMYSIDFFGLSENTIAWGLLTSSNSENSKICARVILIHLPQADSLQRDLGFEIMLERPLKGTAEMLSITNDIVAIYTYRLPNTPSLWICNWRQKMETQITNEAGEYAEHPSLYATPECIFMIGGRVGFSRFHASLEDSSKWNYEKITAIASTERDVSLLRHSSQGRCSRPWWGTTGQPFHRLVTSPRSYDTDDDTRPLRVLSFEEPLGTEDDRPQLGYMELGSHIIVPGVDTSPHLYHISRYGTKVLWLSVDGEDEIIVQTVSLPTFEAQMDGQSPSGVKNLILDERVNRSLLRAFDVDETVPLIAFAEESVVWLVNVADVLSSE